jgi:hypothetical protein
MERREDREEKRMTTKEGSRKPSGSRAGRLASEPALSPGLHAATIELALKGSFRLRLMAGESVRARLGPGVDPALADECLKQRRTVLVTAGPKGPIIVGAVQVTASGRQEKLRLVGEEEIELSAGNRIVLRVGKSLLVIDANGAIQMVGDTMTMKMTKAVRVRSANVELP